MPELVQDCTPAPAPPPPSSRSTASDPAARRSRRLGGLPGLPRDVPDVRHPARLRRRPAEGGGDALLPDAGGARGVARLARVRAPERRCGPPPPTSATSRASSPPWGGSARCPASTRKTPTCPTSRPGSPARSATRRKGSSGSWTGRDHEQQASPGTSPLAGGLSRDIPGGVHAEGGRLRPPPPHPSALRAVRQRRAALVALPQGERVGCRPRAVVADLRHLQHVLAWAEGRRPPTAWRVPRSRTSGPVRGEQETVAASIEAAMADPKGTRERQQAISDAAVSSGGRWPGEGHELHRPGHHAAVCPLEDRGGG